MSIIVASSKASTLQRRWLVWLRENKGKINFPTARKFGRFWGRRTGDANCCVMQAGVYREMALIPRVSATVAATP